MSYFIKIGASRLKQCPNKIKIKMGALKYIIGFVKTCNLKCYIWSLEMKQV
jgi:hypothetical protein